MKFFKKFLSKPTEASGLLSKQNDHRETLDAYTCRIIRLAAGGLFIVIGLSILSVVSASANSINERDPNDRHAWPECATAPSFDKCVSNLLQGFHNLINFSIGIMGVGGLLLAFEAIVIGVKKCYDQKTAKQGLETLNIQSTRHEARL